MADWRKLVRGLNVSRALQNKEGHVVRIGLKHRLEKSVTIEEKRLTISEQNLCIIKWNEVFCQESAGTESAEKRFTAWKKMSADRA